MDLKEIDELSDILKHFPTLTSKQIKNIILYLVKNPSFSVQQLKRLEEILINIKQCQVCTQYSKDNICSICSSKKRENKLLIVENIDQIKKIEEEKIFLGKYYVIPILFNKKFHQLDYDFTFLLDYLSNFEEVIIGISSTAEGILTSNLIFETIRKKSNIKISKLATGIPLGSNIEYVDQVTLSHALRNRKDIE